MSVKVFVLSNGEKIVADVISDTDVNSGVLKVKSPIVLKDVMTEQGLSAYPVPLVPTSSNTIIEILKSGLIVLPCDPDENISKVYQKLTSNIVIPKSNLII